MSGEDVGARAPKTLAPGEDGATPNPRDPNPGEAAAPKGARSARPRGFWSELWASLFGHVPDVAHGRLSRAIPLLAIPMMLEMSMEALFAICDVLFVARVGANAVATVGLTEAMLALVYAVAFGLAMPATAMVARRVGEGNPEAAAEAGAQAVWLGLGLGGLMALPALFAPELLRLMGADAAVVAEGSIYTRLSLLSAPIIVLLFVNSALFRGAGDAAAAMRALWLANLINLVLDPCLIFGLGPFPELGVTGAGVATLIGRGTGLAYQFWLLLRVRRLPAPARAAGPLPLSLRGQMKFHPETMVTLLRLTRGGAMQHLVETGTWVVMVRIVAGFGSVALAGYTVAIRLILFTLMPAWGFSNATATLVGQSLGASDPERAERSVWFSGLYNMAFLGVIALGFLLAPNWLVSFFTEDPEIRSIAAAGIHVISFGYLFYGWQMVCQQAFNGAGDTTTPALINIGCFWVLQLPLAWYLARPYGMGPQGVFVAVTICYSVAGVVSMTLVRLGRWKRVKL